MKPLFTLLLTAHVWLNMLQAQSQIYSTPVTVTDKYLRDSSYVVGQLNLDFPEDGVVFIQFDGVGFGSPHDRIVLAANNYPGWEPNHGATAFISDTINESHCFSHTRRYPVTAGSHSFYAIARNFVDIAGTGIVSIYGRLTVEYIPQSSGVITDISYRYSYFNGAEPVAYDSVTIEATGPGKIEVRLNGYVYLRHGDVIVAAISDSKDWDYTDPFGIAMKTDVHYTTIDGISTTRLYEVPGAGTYTYYAMAQRGYEYEGNGEYYPYTHLHARFYPEEGQYELQSKSIELDNTPLSSGLQILDSIVIEVAQAGKVEIRFDGNLRSDVGDSLLIAVNNQPSYTPEEGHVRLQTTEADEDRHFIVHSNVFDVQPGTHTFYVMVQNQNGATSGPVTIYGNFLVKYFPDEVISSHVNSLDLPFDIWPNPASDRIHIQTPEKNERLKVEILNSQGVRVIHTNKIGSESIDLTSLYPGMYFVKVHQGQESGVRAIVIQ